MAKLFIVGQQPIEPEETPPETDEPETYEVCGDANADTETALRALAFLMEFLDEVGPDELRRCADEIRALRPQR
ncbi:MAG TPA: hypothetical protein VIY66_08520 [Candidatus Acidoferrales bacterium]